MTDRYTWDEVPAEEITHCRKCGKKIWIRWHRSSTAERQLKGFQEKIMDQCARCFFRRK